MAQQDSRKMTCSDYRRSGDNEKRSLVYGYFEGINTALDNAVDVIVPPENDDHPIWWLLPKDGTNVKQLVSKLSAFCKEKENNSKMILQAFLSLAARKQGSPS